MAWDPALLRKYNTTGHFRLLNQIRAELREQPIQRPLVTSRNAQPSASGGTRRAAQGSGRRRGVAGNSTAVASAPVLEHREPAIVAVPILTDVVMPDAHTD